MKDVSEANGYLKLDPSDELSDSQIMSTEFSSALADTGKLPPELSAALEKMRLDGASVTARNVFAHYWLQVAAENTGMISENSIRPLDSVLKLSDLDHHCSASQEALGKTVVIKLNGGLGTSMGLDQPKSMLHVLQEMNFLDLIVSQVLEMRSRYQVDLPLIFMNSFNTQEETRKYLARYPQLQVDGLPIDFLQSREPKILADSLMPVNWSKTKSLEWCPPGHGDIYPSLFSSGLLVKLVEADYRYACVSNCDNLGAVVDPKLAAWFASSGLEFAMEVCRRTRNDRKGGHLATRISDGRTILREISQTSEEDREAFSDIFRHHFFNTNNLWLDLVQLLNELKEKNGVLSLPLIKNVKHVDPNDFTSPKVIQIETAMGTAIEKFEHAGAIEVGRDRFLPVKTTNELLLLRSDLYQLSEDYRLVTDVEDLPVIDLDPKYYRSIADFEERFPSRVSLRQANSVQIIGDWTFGENVTFVGDVSLSSVRSEQVPDGEVIVGNN